MSARTPQSRKLRAASLDLTPEEYFAAAGAMGLLAAQLQEPDPDWA